MCIRDRCAHSGYSHKIVTIFPMYELGIMAYDVAVIRCIVVALKRNVSSSWPVSYTHLDVYKRQRRLFGGGFYNSVKATHVNIEAMDCQNIFGGGMMGLSLIHIYQEMLSRYGYGVYRCRQLCKQGK